MTGYFATNQEYGHVRVRLEYKFGTKRFGSRSEARRDEDYSITYRPGFVWGNNLELQIQEQDVGDLWINGGVSVTSPVIAPEFRSGAAEVVALSQSRVLFQRDELPANGEAVPRPAENPGNPANSQERRFRKS